MKARWKVTLPKHLYGGEPMPGSPAKRTLHPDDRPSFPVSLKNFGYRKVVSHYPGNAPPLYVTKRNTT